jgi:cellulose synthase/poly-beta-1,6-N-acetylglucosamine synthase-like glycosyltransferase
MPNRRESFEARPARRTIPSRVLPAALLLATLLGCAAAATDHRPAEAQALPTTVPQATVPQATAPQATAPRATLPATTLPRTTLPATTLPRTTLPATTAPRVTSPPASAPAAAPPTSAPAATATTTTPGTVPGAGPAAPGTPAPGAAAARGGSGAGDLVRGLLGGDPGGAVRRAIRSLRADLSRLSHLSPIQLALFVLLALFSLLLTAIAGTTLWWMLHAWRTPASLVATGFATSEWGPRESFSLIVPARHEEAVLGATLDRLAASDHPSFEVLAVVGDDDPATRTIAEEAAARHPGRVRVLVDDSQPKSKPRALNAALPACAGSVTAVFDAEDEVHPALLRYVDGRFTDTGADVVQGGVQLMNYRSSWYSLRNVLEYYFWFRSRLHFHARHRFIPLGGNTVFIRTEQLRQAGGWDPDCLAEDCEIGVRLSSRGATVAVAYDPSLATREETPGSLRELFRQRTRWNQGFLQVLRKGDWRRLRTVRQRLLARYTLAMPFLQAFAGVLIPLSLATMILLDLPVLAALLTFVPLVPTLATLVVEAVALGEFCRSYERRATPLDHLRLVLGMFPYHLLLGAAALRAVRRERRGERGWEKTAHVGAHRSAGVSAGQATRRAS